MTIYHKNKQLCKSYVLFIVLTLEAASSSPGTTAVYTRLPLTTSLISMESVVKAKMYGNAQTAITKKKRTKQQ